VGLLAVALLTVSASGVLLLGLRWPWTAEDCDCGLTEVQESRFKGEARRLFGPPPILNVRVEWAQAPERVRGSVEGRVIGFGPFGVETAQYHSMEDGSTITRALRLELVLWLVWLGSSSMLIAVAFFLLWTAP
jgi:hypothetical protein